MHLIDNSRSRRSVMWTCGTISVLKCRVAKFLSRPNFFTTRSQNRRLGQGISRCDILIFTREFGMRNTILDFWKCLHFTNVFGSLYHYVRITRFPGVYSAVSSVPQTPRSIFRWKLALKRRVSDRSTSTNYDFLSRWYILYISRHRRIL